MYGLYNYILLQFAVIQKFFSLLMQNSKQFWYKKNYKRLNEIFR